MSSRIDCDSGTSAAPNTPCSRRAPTICTSVSDSPHSADATVKPAIDTISSRFTLSRSDSQPVSGVAIAAATIYEVSTHVISSCDADSVPRMCGSATFAIVLSRVWISVASMIDRVSIGRFRAGEAGASAAGSSGCLHGAVAVGGDPVWLEL